MVQKHKSKILLNSRGNLVFQNNKLSFGAISKLNLKIPIRKNLFGNFNFGLYDYSEDLSLFNVISNYDLPLNTKKQIKINNFNIYQKFDNYKIGIGTYPTINHKNICTAEPSTSNTIGCGNTKSSLVMKDFENLSINSEFKIKKSLINSTGLSINKNIYRLGTQFNYSFNNQFEGVLNASYSKNDNNQEGLFIGGIISYKNNQNLFPNFTLGYESILNNNRIYNSELYFGGQLNIINSIPFNLGVVTDFENISVETSPIFAYKNIDIKTTFLLNVVNSSFLLGVGFNF